MKNKVYFFSKINNFLLKCLPYILPVTLGLIVLFKFDFIKEKIIKLFGYEFSDIETGVILIIIELIITLLFTTVFKHIGKLKNLSTFIKHKLYSWLRPALKKIKHKIFRVLGNKSINSFYHTNYIPTPEQKRITEFISSILSAKKIDSIENEVLWIQGDTFSGKTMTVSNILIDIISKKTFYNSFKLFDNRILYIDFANDDFSKFINEYDDQKFEDSILIIDNTYILSDRNLLYLITHISSNILAKLIIVCMREFYETTNDPYLIEELNKRISLVGEYFHIIKIKDDFSNIRKNFILSNYYEIDSLSRFDFSTQFHYVNICEKDEQNNREVVKDIINYLNCNIIKTNFNQKVIFMISCFCIFTGSFIESQLSMCFSKRREKISLDMILSELHSCGFIDRSPYGFGKIYIFNSKVAKDYFKLGYISKQFESVMYNIFTNQYIDNEKQNPYLAFLYGCLLKRDYKMQSELFNSLAINTNFKILLNEINFLESVNKELISLYKRELGVLCDRTGEFKKSRSAFKSLLIDAQKQNNINLALESFYRLVQIDHTEYSNFVDLELESCKVKSSYLQLQKKYWKLHIDMHKGKFLLFDFLELIENVQPICHNTNYDYLHLARRIYFDIYRIYFLSGFNDVSKLLEIKEHGNIIQDYLEKNLDEFNLYYKKFTFLFLLKNEILFNLVFDGSVVENRIFEQFIKREKINYTDMSNKDVLLEICIKTCKELEKNFEDIGDKTFNFIRYYRTELLIIQNDPSCKALIKQYRDFGTEEIEYRLYAEYLELKYRISQFLSIERIGTDSDKERENLKLKIDEQFDVILNFFNDSYTNDYAKMRYYVYKLLMAILDNNSEESSKYFKDALELAEKNNYNREIRILKKINDLKGNISFGLCRNILLYYPIVPQ